MSWGIYAKAINEIYQTNEAQEKMVENIKEKMVNGLDTSDIDNGEDIVIQETDIAIIISKNDYKQ